MCTQDKVALQFWPLDFNSLIGPYFIGRGRRLQQLIIGSRMLMTINFMILSLIYIHDRKLFKNIVGYTYLFLKCGNMLTRV